MNQPVLTYESPVQARARRRLSRLSVASFIIAVLCCPIVPAVLISASDERRARHVYGAEAARLLDALQTYALPAMSLLFSTFVLLRLLLARRKLRGLKYVFVAFLISGFWLLGFALINSLPRGFLTPPLD